MGCENINVNDSSETLARLMAARPDMYYSNSAGRTHFSRTLQDHASVLRKMGKLPMGW